MENQSVLLFTEEELKSSRMESHSMVAYDYDPVLLRLKVTTKGGIIYQYFDVPANIIDDLRESKHPDRYYLQSIRNRYKRLFNGWDYSYL